MLSRNQGRIGFDGVLEAISRYISRGIREPIGRRSNDLVLKTIRVKRWASICWLIGGGAPDTVEEKFSGKSRNSSMITSKRKENGKLNALISDQKNENSLFV